MGQSFNADPGVTYVRPRTLIIGFALYCVGFLGLLFGADRITESYESREQIGGALAPSTASPAGPARSAGTALAPGSRSHAATSTALCAPVPPCSASKLKPKLAVPAAGPKAAAPVPAPPAAVRTAAPHAVPSRTAPPSAAPSRSAAPPSVPSRTAPPSAARAVHAPATLLVPFTNASGLTSSGGLDPRRAAHAPLVVGPTSGLGANPAATPFGGSANPNPR